METKTYTRKTRAGYKVVHRKVEGTENSAVIVQPLSRQDACVLSKTFRERSSKQ